MNKEKELGKKYGTTILEEKKTHIYLLNSITVFEKN